MTQCGSGVTCRATLYQARQGQPATVGRVEDGQEVEDGTSARLSAAVARAADAWLTDPLDVQVYKRLVDSTLRWRAYTSEHPAPAGPPSPHPGSATVAPPEVARVGDLMRPEDPRATLARLLGKGPSSAPTPAP